MRNVLEASGAVLPHPHQMRPLLHGASRRPTIPPNPPCGSISLVAGALALAGLLHVLPTHAIEFGSGELQGSLDTTISHGLTYRVEERNPGLSADTNGNDGNLNYDRGLVSNTSKFTTDLDIGAGDFGAFVRATGFIDFENQNGVRERTPLSDPAKERVGKDLEVLDAYVTGTFDAGDAIVDARLGKHVLNWGESTFIPNGINAINHFDVSKLRLPGSELREALLPVGLASLSVAPTDTLSLEAFYQFDWEETEIDPVGSYFSSTDYVGPGAERAVVDDPRLRIPGINLGDTGTEGYHSFEAFGIEADPYDLLGIEPDRDFMNVERTQDRSPRDSGQWGGALRYLAEGLNDTEFGFFFMNYHSRLPIVGARTGTQSGALAGLGRAGEVGANAPAAVGHLVARALAAAGCTFPPATPACAQIAAEAQTRATAWVTAVSRAVVPQAGIDVYAESAEYFIEYPEDIRLFGVSFNTLLGASGWALQGEYSLRHDAPLQIAEREILGAGLAPFLQCLGASNLAGPAAGLACVNSDAPGTAGFDADVQGYVRREVSQIQATATRVFGPTMGADGLVFLTEVALMHVHDMPDDTPLESPAGGILSTPDADADATSWGYRVAARLDYNNALGAANLYPYMQFLHDVNGNSPAPSGPFVEGRTALTLGIRADYLSRWQANLGYTRYAGDGNELSDRDFISASIKYSF